MLFAVLLIVVGLVLLLKAGTAFPGLDPEPLPPTPPPPPSPPSPPTGGTYTITIAGRTSAPIPYDTPLPIDPIELHRLADDGGPHVD